MENKIINSQTKYTIIFWNSFVFFLIIAAICAVLSPSHISDDIVAAHITPNSVSTVDHGNTETASNIKYTLIEELSIENDRFYLNPDNTVKISVSIIPKTSLNTNLQWSSSNENVAKVDDNGLVTAISPGYAKINVTSDTGVKATAFISVYNICAASHLINVPIILQGEEFLNGCESVSAVMSLNYAGINIDVKTFIDKYLDWKYFERDENDDKARYGYSPWKIYNGYPCDVSGSYCYSPVIVSAMKKFVNPYYYKIDELRGKSMMQLCSDYVSKDIPVIVWVTEEMQELYAEDFSWLDIDTNEQYVLMRPIHCMLLVGYDQNYYYFNDSLKGKSIKYPRNESDTAYEALFMQAIAVYPR